MNRMSFALTLAGLLVTLGPAPVAAETVVLVGPGAAVLAPVPDGWGALPEGLARWAVQDGGSGQALIPPGSLTAWPEMPSGAPPAGLHAWAETHDPVTPALHLLQMADAGAQFGLDKRIIKIAPEELSHLWLPAPDAWLK